MNKPNSKFRSNARKLALQALYQWLVSNVSVADVEQQFLQHQKLNKVDVPYFQELLKGIPEQAHILDEQMSPILDRTISELDPVELIIMRIAIYELLYRIDVPYRVVINEALELAKTFGSTDGFKYVNGILDKVAKKVRAAEMK